MMMNDYAVGLLMIAMLIIGLFEVFYKED